MLMNWQRANTQAAAGYLREAFTRNPTDARVRAIYEGLLDVLEPTRRAVRLQREMASAAKAAATIQRERRQARERRKATERRTADLGSPSGAERRAATRRVGRDRRNLS
jgi:hypothetical protein